MERRLMLQEYWMNNYQHGKCCPSVAVLVVFSPPLHDCTQIGIGAIKGCGVFWLVLGKNVFGNRAVWLMGVGMFCTADSAMD